MGLVWNLNVVHGKYRWFRKACFWYWNPGLSLNLDMDKEKIAKTVKVNNKIVSKIVDAFEQEWLAGILSENFILVILRLHETMRIFCKCWQMNIKWI